MGNCVSEDKRTNHKRLVTRLSELNSTNIKIIKSQELIHTIPKKSSHIINSTPIKIFNQIKVYFQNDNLFSPINPMYQVQSACFFSTKETILKFQKYNDLLIDIFSPKSNMFNSDFFLITLEKSNFLPLKLILEFEKCTLGKYVQMGTYTILENQLIHSEETDNKSFSIFRVKLPQKSSKRRFKWVFLLKIILLENDILYVITLNVENSPWVSNEMCSQTINESKEKENLKKRKRNKLKSEYSLLQTPSDILSFDIYTLETCKRGQILSLENNKVKLIVRSFGKKSKRK